MQNPVPSLNDEKSHTALKGLDSKDGWSRPEQTPGGKQSRGRTADQTLSQTL